VKGISGAKQAIAGTSGYVLKKDGTVWAITMQGPSQIQGLSGITSLETTNHTYYALKSDGTVWAWGTNGDGELGVGSKDYRLGATPVKVSGLTGVKALAANSSGRYPGHAYALKTDGTVWAWGSNGSGQLGDGTYTGRTIPVQVKGLSGVTSIAATSGGAHAAKTDGTVWAWGDNFQGKLALPVATRSYPVPTKVPGLSAVASVAASSYTAYALKKDGTVMAWGNASRGQLGNGTTPEFSATPVVVPGLAGVKSLTGAMSGAYAVKNDGSTWAWGANWTGDAGDGTTTTRSKPVLTLRGP
jgi:alpha-tubulin suppressor-like RCC1 family protein